MRLKAVLGIKSANGIKLIKYRVQDLNTNQIKDIPIKVIIEAIETKGIHIEGLKLQGNEIVETYNIPKIPELRESSISLYDWCLSEPTGYGKQLLQEYIQGNNDITPDKVAYGSRQKAYFRCSNCGEINYESIGIRTKQKRKYCIKCDKNKTSFGEQLILKWLQSQRLQAINQHPITNEIGHKKFDIYLPQLNLVIEKQSPEHLSTEQQFRDETGALIAQHQGINYLEVCELTSKYFREENNWCLTYKKGHEPDIIQKLSNWLFKNYNIQTNPNYTRELEDEAYLASCTVKKENSLAAHNPPFLKEWYQPLNGKVTPDIVALNANRKYYWQCPICGHIYLSTPNSRNNMKTACPKWRQHRK